jgi:rod shape-determining protein MreC
MKYVLQSEDIRPEDIIVVSGLEGVFPKGAIVGRIKSVKQSKSSLLFNVLVKPAVEFEKLEEVFVVLER